VILTTYMDESGTHGPSDYMIMGGIVGRLGQWVDYDKRWNRLLKKNLLTYFHSKKLRAREGEFKNWSDGSAAAIIRDIDKLQNRNSLFRFVTLVKKDEFQKFYKSGDKPKKLQLDSIYGLAFRCSLSFAVEMALRSGLRNDLTMNFIVESGHVNAGACKVIFDQIKKHVAEMAGILGDCLVKHKKDYPGLQGADAVSYAGYQQEYHGNESELMHFEVDWNLENAQQILKAKSPVFRSYVRPEILSKMRENLFKLEEKRRQFGSNPLPISSGEQSS